MFCSSAFFTSINRQPCIIHTATPIQRQALDNISFWGFRTDNLLWLNNLASIPVASPINTACSDYDVAQLKEKLFNKMSMLKVVCLCLVVLAVLGPIALAGISLHLFQVTDDDLIDNCFRIRTCWETISIWLCRWLWSSSQNTKAQQCQ